MSNDLISRKDLRDRLRGNVLVDVTTALERAIYDEPTAYDVDEIIKRIDDLVQIKTNAGEFISKEDAKRIIRAEGV